MLLIAVQQIHTLFNMQTLHLYCFICRQRNYLHSATWNAGALVASVMYTSPIWQTYMSQTCETGMQHACITLLALVHKLVGHFLRCQHTHTKEVRSNGLLDQAGNLQ